MDNNESNKNFLSLNIEAFHSYMLEKCFPVRDKNLDLKQMETLCRNFPTENEEDQQEFTNENSNYELLFYSKLHNNEPHICAFRNKLSNKMVNTVNGKK